MWPLDWPPRYAKSRMLKIRYASTRPERLGYVYPVMACLWRRYAPATDADTGGNGHLSAH